MKMTNHSNSFEDVVVGAESEAQFSIDGESEVIFDILRSKMYSDKIGAICREVASNSRDANREAGRGHIPVVIAIHGEDSELMKSGAISSTSISFEDCGPGITPERMADVFLKYGASTKRSTNAQTGGFGLGAKTPFAYADTFTIATVCDVDGKRMKYIYSAIIDSSGKGKMVLFESSEVDSNTGTKIIVPIKGYDRGEFETKSQTMSTFWEVRPEFRGFQATVSTADLELTHTCDEGELSFKVYDGSKMPMSLHSRVIALIDGIPYSIKDEEIEDRDTWSWGNPVVLEFDNGELTISASREELQYDEQTRKIINERLVATKEILETICLEKFNSLDSYVQKVVEFGSNSMTAKFVRASGLKMSSQFNVPGLKAERVSRNNRGKLDYTFTATINDVWTQPVYFMDTKKDRRRLTTLLKDGGTFILLSEISEGVGAEKKVDMAFNWGLDLRLFSSIAKADLAPGTTSAYTKKPEVIVKAKSVNSGYARELTYVRETETITDAEDYVYIQVDSLRDYKEGFSWSKSCLARIIKETSGKTLVAVNNKSAERYMDSVQTLEEYLPTFKKTYAAELKKMQMASKSAQMKSILSSNGMMYVAQVSKSQVFDEALEIMNTPDHKLGTEYNAIVGGGYIDANATVLSAEEYTEAANLFYKEYPLAKPAFEDLRWAGSDVIEETIEQVKLYIDLMDGRKKNLKACA